MSRAYKLPVSMAIIVAALLSTSSPALATDGSNDSLATIPGESAPQTPETQPALPALPPVSTSDNGAVMSLQDGMSEVPGPSSSPDVNIPTDPEQEASNSNQEPSVAVIAPLTPPQFTKNYAESGAAAFNWRYATGDSATSGGARVTLWDAEFGGNIVKTCTASAPTTYCTVQGLTLYQKYWASVQRWMPGEIYSEHSARELIQPRLRPGIPTNLEAAIVGYTIEVSWTKVADPIDAPVTNYWVWIGTKEAGDFQSYNGNWARGSADSLVIPLTDFQHEYLHGKTPLLYMTAENDVGESERAPRLTLTQQLPLTGDKPLLGDPVRTADGFTIKMASEDPTFEYAVTATAGAVKRAGTTITVSGLTPGTQSTIQVVTSKVGHFSNSATKTGYAGFEPVNPTFDVPVSTADGFTVKITNFDDKITYGLNAHSGAQPPAIATRKGDVVTVSGLAPGVSAYVSVTTSREGWNPGSNSTYGSALRAASSSPIFAESRPMDGGFTAALTNYNGGGEYRVDQPVTGTASIWNGLLIVTGLAPNREATVRVYSILPGEAEASTTVTGSSSKNPAVQFSITGVTPTADGWGARINNYELLADENTSFTIESSEGSATVTDGVVKVSGLAPNQTATVTVTLTRTDTVTSTATARGTALEEHTVTFDAGMGQPVSTTAAVTHGQPAQAPALPTRDRYAFTGWYIDPELQTLYAFEDAVTADLTLHAGWEISAYAVTWHENWPGAGSPVTDVVPGKTLGSLPDPSAAGWVITDWNTEPDGSGTSVTTSTSLALVATGTEVSLYAIWAKRTLSLALSAASVASGSTVTLTATANAAFGGIDDVTDKVKITSTEPSDVIAPPNVRVDVAGTRTLTGSFDGATDLAQIEVVAGPLAKLAITPSATTVARGGKLEFSVAGSDAAGNPVAIDSNDVTLTSDVMTDVVDGLTVTFPTASLHRISATVGDVVATVKVEVHGDSDSTVSPTPWTPAGDESALPNTGGGPVTGASAIGAVLLLAGATLVISRRRGAARG